MLKMFVRVERGREKLLELDIGKSESLLGGCRMLGEWVVGFFCYRVF